MPAGNDLTLKVGFDIDKFQAEINKTSGILNKWGASVQNTLMGVAAGFSAMRVADFVLDISKLAGEAEGVKAAFDKLPNSIDLMLRLKEATKGTVSELDLMKRAVAAQNFNINLEALPKLLEFAAVRAKQTGQSVDYLVDSIVTGIGRKSLLILDNLGLSSTRINEELKKTPDYATAIGNIAASELQKMGSMSENTSTKLERLNASWENLKVTLGGTANSTGVLGTATDKLTQALDAVAKLFIKSEQGAQTTWDPEPPKKLAKEIENIASLTEKLNFEKERQNILVGDELAQSNRLIQSYEEKIKKLKELGIVQQQAGSKLNVQTPQFDFFGDLTKNIDQVASVGVKLQGAIQPLQKPIIDFQKNLQQLGLVAIEMGPVISQGLANIAVGFGEALGNVISGVGGMEQFGAALLSGIGNMAQQLGQLAIATGIAVGGIKKALQTLNPVVAIAAGVALVALGKLVSNKAAAIASGGGGGGSFGGGSGRSQTGGLKLESLGQRIEITGTIKADGKQLAVVLANHNRRDTRTKAG